MNLTSEQLIEILSESNLWRQNQDTGIKRDSYLQELSKLAHEGMAVTIIGARRSGKSTIMYQLIKRLIDTGVPRENTLHVNFEDPRFYGATEAEETIKGFRIRYVPAWKFLLR